MWKGNITVAKEFEGKVFNPRKYKLEYEIFDKWGFEDCELNNDEFAILLHTSKELRKYIISWQLTKSLQEYGDIELGTEFIISYEPECLLAIAEIEMKSFSVFNSKKKRTEEIREVIYWYTGRDGERRYTKRENIKTKKEVSSAIDWYKKSLLKLDNALTLFIK